jgi:hypothetical protein
MAGVLGGFDLTMAYVESAYILCNPVYMLFHLVADFKEEQ